MSDGALSQAEIEALLAGVKKPGCTLSEDVSSAERLTSFLHRFSSAMAKVESPDFSMSDAPVELRPRGVAECQRVQEICAAVIGYKKASKAVPAEWLDELRDLTEKPC